MPVHACVARPCAAPHRMHHIRLQQEQMDGNSCIWRICRTAGGEDDAIRVSSGCRWTSLISACVAGLRHSRRAPTDLVSCTDTEHVRISGSRCVMCLATMPGAMHSVIWWSHGLCTSRCEYFAMAPMHARLVPWPGTSGCGVPSQCNQNP